MATCYSGVAIALHWLMAVLIVGLFGLGTYMTNLDLSPQKLKLYAWHKWAGVTIFALVWLRLMWRLVKRPPALPPQMPRWEKKAARASHVALYALMIAAPLSGWLMSSAGGFQTVWFGVVPLPDLLVKNPAHFERLKDLHNALTTGFMWLVGLHVLAALKHHVIDRDDVLTRILPKVRS